MTYAEELEQEVRHECTKEWPTLKVSTGSDASLLPNGVMVGTGSRNDDRRLLIRFRGAPDNRRYDLSYLPTPSTSVPPKRQVHDYGYDQMMVAVLDFLRMPISGDAATRAALAEVRR